MQVNTIKLNLIFKTLGITARELSTAIHVDCTLISKWKNGHRKLTLRSSHFNNIIEYILNLNRPFLIDKLNKLSILSNDTAIFSETNIKEVLITWLIQNDDNSSILNFDCKSSSYSAICNIYISNKGKRTAISRLLDMALSLPDGQVLSIFSFENRTWLIEDKFFLAEYIEKMTKLVKQNCTINLIRVFENASNCEMFWLENELFYKYSNNIHNWFLPLYSGLVMNNSLHILEGHAVITSFSCPSHESSYTFFTDPFTIQSYSNIFATLLSKSKQLLFSLKLEHFTKKVYPLYQKTHNTIRIYRCGLSMFLLPRDLLIEILYENDVSCEVFNQICYIYDTTSKYGENISSKLVYSYEFLNPEIVMSNHYLSDLSILLEKTIYINHFQFKEYLKNVLKILNENSRFEMGFLTQEDEAYSQKINITIVENSLVLLADVSNLQPVCHFIREPIYIYNYYNIYHNVWNSIALPLRNKEFVIKNIEKLIESI